MASYKVDKIRTRRKEAGLTQAELAEKIGVSTMSIRRYESGDRIITDDILGRIANALNVSLFEFYEDGTKVYVNGEEFTISDGTAIRWSDPSKDRINAAVDQMNEKGRNLAADAVEAIAGNPEYKK